MKELIAYLLSTIANSEACQDFHYSGTRRVHVREHGRDVLVSGSQRRGRRSRCSRRIMMMMMMMMRGGRRRQGNSLIISMLFTSTPNEAAVISRIFLIHTPVCASFLVVWKIFTNVFKMLIILRASGAS